MQLGTLSSLVLLVLPVTTVAVVADPVSVNWDALNQGTGGSAPIVLNPVNPTVPTPAAPTPAVPPKTKTFTLTTPKLLNPKNNPTLASQPVKAAPNKELRAAKRQPIPVTKKQKAPASTSVPTAQRVAKPVTKKVITKPSPKKIVKQAPSNKTATATPTPAAKLPVTKPLAVKPVAPTPHMQSASTPAPKTPSNKDVAKPEANKLTARPAPTKRIPTKLPTRQTTKKVQQAVAKTAQVPAKKTPARGTNYAAVMQQNLALLPAPRAEIDGHWGTEPENKSLPATQVKGFNVATFGSPKPSRTTPTRKPASHASAPTQAGVKPSKPVSPIINASAPTARRIVPNAIEETARELAAIEDAPMRPRTLRSPEPAEGRIVFDTGSTQLMSSGRSTLAALAKKLNQSAARIQLKAYSSSNTLTSVSAQRRLSLRRAMAVRKHLTTEFGISSSRIDVRVLGTVKDSGPGDRVDIVMASS